MNAAFHIGYSGNFEPAKHLVAVVQAPGAPNVDFGFLLTAASSMSFDPVRKSRFSVVRRTSQIWKFSSCHQKVQTKNAWQTSFFFFAYVVLSI